jgi:hypothetical protein
MGHSGYLGVPIEFADGKQYEIRNHIALRFKLSWLRLLKQRKTRLDLVRMSIREISKEVARKDAKVVGFGLWFDGKLLEPDWGITGLSSKLQAAGIQIEFDLTSKQGRGGGGGGRTPAQNTS